MGRTRIAVTVVALGLVGAACGRAATSTSAAPPTAPDAPSTTSAAFGTVQAQRLSYAYEDVETVEYLLSIDQTVAMHNDGDVPPDESGDLPVDVAIHSVLEGPIRYETSPGPEPGTTRIRIVTELTDVSVEGTVDGVPADGTEGLDDVGAIAPIDVTVVVDDQGTIVSVDGDEFGDVSGFLGNQGTAGLGFVGNQQLGRPVGPAFPDQPVTIGDSWTEVTETEGPDGPIVTTATHTLVATETVDGTDVVVVESSYETEEIEMDLGRLLRDMFTGLADGVGADPEMSPEDRAELEAAFEEIAFVIHVEPTMSTAVSRFSPDTGLVVSADVEVDAAMSMDVRVPDETGGVRSLTTEMTIHQSMRYELVGDGA